MNSLTSMSWLLHSGTGIFSLIYITQNTSFSTNRGLSKSLSSLSKEYQKKGHGNVLSFFECELHKFGPYQKISKYIKKRLFFVRFFEQNKEQQSSEISEARRRASFFLFVFFLSWPAIDTAMFTFVFVIRSNVIFQLTLLLPFYVRGESNNLCPPWA